MDCIAAQINNPLCRLPADSQAGTMQRNKDVARGEALWA